MPVDRLHLPSGCIAELDRARRSAAQGTGLFARDIDAFRGRLLSADGVEISLHDLALADFHTLRALLRRLGYLEEQPIEVICDNCEHAFRVRPCASLELGPYRDGELDDPDLDGAFDFGQGFTVGELGELCLLPRTLAQARPLHEARALPAGFRITSRVVSAMGMASLNGERDPRRIARALARASDEDFGAVCALFEEAHYPLRLVTPHPCPECGVMSWQPAPAARELSSQAEPSLARPLSAAPGFPDIDAFERLVRVEADAAYRELSLRNIDLVVMEGPAEHDDAGEPLLGCYRPADPDTLPPEPHEIRVFYRTFFNMWADEGPYDVRAEVAETLRHELQHHISYLSGTDPVDDEEHAEIDRDVARRVGRGEARRRAVRELGRDLGTFFRSTWLLWLAVLVATLLAAVAER